MRAISRFDIHLSGAQVVFGVVLLMIAFLTLTPLAMVAFGSLTTSRPGTPSDGLTLQVLFRAYTNERFWAAGFTTVVYALGVTAISVAAGTFLAWAVERTNAPFRNAIFLLSVVRLIVPGLMLTMAWIFLLGPNAGIINVWAMDLFGLESPPFNVFSLPGMIFVEGLQTTPIPFLLMVAAFRSMDPSLEEAARASGANMARTTTKITLSLVRPAFLAAALISFVNAFEGFETPALIGLRAEEPVRTFATEIWLSLARTVRTDFNLASAYSIIFLAVSMIGMYAYLRATRRAERFATVTGKGFRSSAIDLGIWRWPTALLCFLIVGLMFVLPVLALIWRSLQPFANAPSPETFALLTLRNWDVILGLDLLWDALRNSLIIASVVGTVVIALCAVAGWLIVRSRVRAGGLLDILMFIPISMPGLVMGLAFLWFALSAAPLLYGTLAIICVAHVAKNLPYGMRFSLASMIQIHSELEGAAYASGASPMQTFRRIVLPLLAPGLIAGFIFVFIASVRELPTALLLQGFGTQTFPVALFDRFDERQGQAAAMALVGVAVLGLLVVVARWVGGHLGVRASNDVR